MAANPTDSGQTSKRRLRKKQNDLDSHYGKGFTAFLWSIAMQESGGNYGDVNKSSGALGRYQVMPANVASWTQRALGHSLTPEQFLADPKAQDKTVFAILGHDFQKYGPRGAAATWYSGQPSLANDYSPQPNGPSVGAYVDSVMGRVSSAPAKVDFATGSTKVDAGALMDATSGGPSMPSSHLSKGAIAEGLNSLGFASQLIHSNKSLMGAFNEILSKQLDLTSSAGQARAKQILQNTAWFQNHTKNQREFEELKFSDPQTWQKSIDDTRASLVNEAKSMGLSIDPNELDHLAHMVTRNGLTSDEINHVLSKQFDYSKGQAYDGTAGQTIDSIRQQAASYYVPVSDGQIQHYTRQVLSGALDPQSLADTFKQQALSLYPYLKQQLDSGQTVADIADPYKQMMAQTLELDPNAIKHTDPTVLKALQSTDQHGNVGIMPLWQFQQHLYSDPRWMQTQNAHESLVGTTGSILQKMGLIT